MELISRPAVLEDFDEFYATCFPADGDNLTLRTIVKYEWDVLLRRPTTLSVMLEDKDQPAGQRIVGCGQAVFVTAEFAHLARCGLPPWINAHVTRARPDGTHPYLLDLKGIRAANSGAGLSSVTTRLTITAERFSLAESNYLRLCLYNAFSLLTRGYKFKEVFIEVTGEAPMLEGLRAGYRVFNDYTAYYREQGISPPVHARPYLLYAAREEALLHEGNTISYIFAYTPPRIFFTEREQELLCLAIAGVDDVSLATRLHLSPGSISKRWQDIYKRTQERLPDLLPFACEDKAATNKVEMGKKGIESVKRGVEKKRVLLRYLQTHLEELRPVEPPRHIPPSQPIR